MPMNQLLSEEEVITIIRSFAAPAGAGLDLGLTPNHPFYQNWVPDQWVQDAVQEAVKVAIRRKWDEEHNPRVLVKRNRDQQVYFRVGDLVYNYEEPPLDHSPRTVSYKPVRVAKGVNDDPNCG